MLLWNKNSKMVQCFVFAYIVQNESQPLINGWSNKLAKNKKDKESRGLHWYNLDRGAQAGAQTSTEKNNF